MLTELCQELRNWFDRDMKKVYGEFRIFSGGIEVLGAGDSLSQILKRGQYFRIIGSILNDGVYQYGIDELSDNEEFSGAVWAMAVPKQIVQLAVDIQTWKEKYQEKSNSLYTSEAFKGYSYNKALGKNGVGTTWQEVFVARLAPWRKI